MRYPKTDYAFENFEPSQRLHKKYNAVLRNIRTGRQVRIPFGDTRYEQYKDNTGLGLWSHKDHGDEKRKRAYWSRHRKEANAGISNYTAGSMALTYLW